MATDKVNGKSESDAKGASKAQAASEGDGIIYTNEGAAGSVNAGKSQDISEEVSSIQKDKLVLDGSARALKSPTGSEGDEIIHANEGASGAVVTGKSQKSVEEAKSMLKGSSIGETRKEPISLDGSGRALGSPILSRHEKKGADGPVVARESQNPYEETESLRKRNTGRSEENEEIVLDYTGRPFRSPIVREGNESTQAKKGIDFSVVPHKAPILSEEAKRTLKSRTEPWWEELVLRQGASAFGSPVGNEGDESRHGKKGTDGSGVPRKAPILSEEAKRMLKSRRTEPWWEGIVLRQGSSAFGSPVGSEGDESGHGKKGPDFSVVTGESRKTSEEAESPAKRRNTEKVKGENSAALVLDYTGRPFRSPIVREGNESTQAKKAIDFSVVPHKAPILSEEAKRTLKSRTEPWWEELVLHQGASAFGSPVGNEGDESRHGKKGTGGSGVPRKAPILSEEAKLMLKSRRTEPWWEGIVLRQGASAFGSPVGSEGDESGHGKKGPDCSVVTGESRKTSKEAESPAKGRNTEKVKGENSAASGNKGNAEDEKEGSQEKPS